MKAFAIVIKGHPLSEYGYSVLKESSEKVGNTFEIEKFDAYDVMRAHDFVTRSENPVHWSYPWKGEEVSIPLGLKMKAYATSTSAYARVGCFLSHYHLWKKSVELDEDVLILEHDAYFLKQYHAPIAMRHHAMSLNDPRGATRKAQVYHDKLQSGAGNPVECPWIDDDRAIPQGLPGNSAYVIGPGMAQRAIDFVAKHGAWPNDALLCKQNFPNALWCLKDYATTIQGLGSTTTG